MASTDITLLNALAARIGENAVMEMVEAWMEAVQQRRAGIEPPSWTQQDEDAGAMPALIPLDEAAPDAPDVPDTRLAVLNRLDREMRAATPNNLAPLHAAIVDAQWQGLINDPAYIDACSRLEALYAVMDEY